MRMEFGFGAVGGGGGGVVHQSAIFNKLKSIITKIKMVNHQYFFMITNKLYLLLYDKYVKHIHLIAQADIFIHVFIFFYYIHNQDDVPCRAVPCHSSSMYCLSTHTYIQKPMSYNISREIK